MNDILNEYKPPRGRPYPHTVPNIPAPARHEIPVIEQLTAPIPRHETRPAAHKAEPTPILEPHYNELYDQLETKDGWRYLASAFASGSFTPVAGSSLLVPVTIAAMPQPLQLQQWPGAVQAYWVVRFFSLAPQSSFSGTVPVETQVPATAGSVTIFTGKGQLISAVVTATGTTTLTFQDGAGNIIGEVLSTATVGQEIIFNAGFNVSLVANKSATTPVVTVTYLPDAGSALTPGSLEIDLQDNLSTNPLGIYLSSTGGQTSNDTIMLNPITDPANATIGNLLVTLQPGGASAVTYSWHMGLGVAYLKPTTQPYVKIYGDPHDTNINLHK